MRCTSKLFGFLLVVLPLSTTPQMAAAAETAQAPAALATSAAANDVASEPTREELAAELERQRRIAENARYQVERLRAEIALKDELLELGRQRNRELYDTGSEILNRYAELDFGDVISAREPFIQKGRVELENLVQSYEDALRAARFTEDTLPPSVEKRMREELARMRESSVSQASQDHQAEAGDGHAQAE